LLEQGNTKEAALSKQQAVEEAKELPKPPAPTATGNERIAILKHDISVEQVERDLEYGRYPTPAFVELAIRNVSDSTIATAVFEAVFYDQEGNILDTAKHKEVDLKPDTSRAIHITSSISEYEKVRSYDVRIIRTTTADVEKVQLRRTELRTTETGEEEIVGTVKNMSKVKTDAAVVATFYDFSQEDISTKVLILRDIEPDTVRKFEFKFKPQEGDVVRSCTINIGEVVE